MEPHICSPENAPQFLDWIQNREGIAVWKTVNLSNPGQSWSMPVISKEGERLKRPHAYAEASPSRIITNPDDVLVETGKEVKRFHIALKQGGILGTKFSVTDGGTRRIKAEVAKATEKYGKEAWYEFDYSTQDAVVMIPDLQITLTAYAKEKGL